MNALIFALLFSSVSPSYEYREPKTYVVAPSAFILMPELEVQPKAYHPWYLPDYMRERPEPKYKRIPWK